MIQKFILVALCAALALPAHAGQGTIQETDTQIIIEYSGSDDDVKAAQIQHEEVQKQVQEEDAEIKKKEAEEQRHQERMEQAKRRAANRGLGVFTEQ
jgi:basic membrane lipoprotein Med (substrate-binding protein (PBP1-ABC) superfamily)